MVLSHGSTRGASSLKQATMDFQKVLGASLAVQLVDVLGDDHDAAALAVQPGLTLGDGQVPRVGLLALHHLPPVVVELPHPGGVAGKGLRGGQVLSLPLPPVTSGPSERRDSAFGADAGPRNDDYVLCLCKTLPEICHT